MKFDFLKSVSPLEIILFIIFVVYIIFPVKTPGAIAPMINSSFGMVIILIGTIYLFFYTTPILAILAVLAAYELIRRSADVAITATKATVLQYTPTQEQKDVFMQDMNPPKLQTLEEEMVSKMAPVGKSDPSTYIETSYKPVADPLLCGSMCS
jgi:hypothetical protein